MDFRNAALLALSLLAAAGCSSSPSKTIEAPPPGAEATEEAPSEVTLEPSLASRVRTVKVRSELAPETFEATGRIIPAEDRTWRIGAVVEGRIEKTNVEVGDRVKANSLLAGMHSHDIHDSRADYRAAVSEKQRAEESLTIATRQRDRARRLFELKAGSSEQVDAAESEVVRAQAAVRAAEVEVGRVFQHITEVLQVSVVAPEESADEHDNDLIPIKSPEPGIVLRRLITTGTVVTAGQELFVIADLSKVLLIAQVSEAYLSRLRAGQAVTVKVQSYPDREFQGRIERIGEELDPQTRTIQARIALANPSGALKPESYATAFIPVGSSRPALFIPSAAVQDIDGVNNVFVATGPGKYEMRPVSLGRAITDRVEIVEGLTAGDEVAVAGAFLLKSQMLRARIGE